MKIQKTKNYKQFKFFKYNRELYMPHVKNLMISLGKHNLLPFLPILVDKEMRVLDGQHRLAAAKALKLEIFYIVLNEASFEDVLLLNTNSRKWISQDYLNMFCEMRLKDYLILKDFCDKWRLGIPLSIGILSGTSPRDGGVYMKFKTGNLKVKDLEKAELLAGRVTKLRIFCEDNCWRDREFLRALVKVQEKGYFDRLFDNVKASGVKIARQSTWRQYLRSMEVYINRKNKKEANFVRLFG